MREREIHDAFIRYLDKHGYTYHHSRMDRETSMKCGDPDFIVTRDSRVLYVEVKVKGGKLSPAQTDRIAELQAAGNTVLICWSIEECVTAVESFFGSSAPVTRPEPQKLNSGDSGANAGLFLMLWQGAWKVVRPVNGKKDDVAVVRKATELDLNQLPRL